MASYNQRTANAANAQLSTGPRTEEGKERSSRNAVSHGLAGGVLVIAPEDRPAFKQFEAALIEDMKPEGALEMDAVREFCDAAWRLKKVRACLHALFVEHGADPFVHPETEVAVRQLSRYRASAEMLLHRALETLRDLQTTRLGRIIHLAKSEQESIGPLAAPKSFARMVVDRVIMNRVNRDRFDDFHNITEVS